MFGSSSTTRMRTGMRLFHHGGCARRARNGDREARPGARRVLRPDAAASRGKQASRDREAHARAEGRLPCDAAAVEALEEMVELARIEPRTVVGHRHLEAARA